MLDKWHRFYLRSSFQVDKNGDDTYFIYFCSRELARVKCFKWDLTQSKFGYYRLPSVALRRYTPSAMGLRGARGHGELAQTMLSSWLGYASTSLPHDWSVLRTHFWPSKSFTKPSQFYLLAPVPSSRGHLFLCVAGALCVPFCVSEHCLTGTIAWMLGGCFSCQDTSSSKAKTIAFTSYSFPLAQIDSVLLK